MPVKPGLIALSTSVAALLTACAQPETTVTETDVELDSVRTVQLAPPITTVKPGASVTFSHTVSDKLQAGENGSATITVHEGYPSGVLHLQASGDEALEVFGAETTARMDMSSGTTHTWRVDFASETDGVHYIHVLARVELDGGYSESRAYAVRVEIGDWQSAQAKIEAARDVEMMANGEPVMVMPAEETIE